MASHASCGISEEENSNITSEEGPKTKVVPMMTGSEPAWQFQHSVDCAAPRQFAWNYWTDVANWNDPPANFQLDGPFAVGSQIMTSLPDQTLYSVIRWVLAGREAVIEMQLAEAVLSCHWTFEDLTADTSRISQRIALSGSNAAVFVAHARVLEQTTPEGMKKLVASIERSLNAA